MTHSGKADISQDRSVAREPPLTKSGPQSEKSGLESNSASVKPIMERNRLGAALQVSASLIWIPQAGLLSVAVGEIASGKAVGAVIWNAAFVLLLGIVRSVVDGIGTRIAFRQARTALSFHRRAAVAALASGSPLDVARPASGLAASTLTEQAEAIVPYFARYHPAKLRATAVPSVILLCVLAFSWVAALVLLLAAPLIPIFMALVGWRAKTASEAQLIKLGDMNTFLLDRLRGLTTIRSMQAVDATAKQLRDDADGLRTRTMAVLRIAFLSSAVLELFAALGVAMVAVYVGFHLLGQLPFGAWGNRLSLSEGLFILLLAPAFFEPLRDLSGVWHDRAAGEAALEALQNVSQRGQPLPGAAYDLAPTQPAAKPPSIRMEHLTFRHGPDCEPVFEDFSLSVASGEHVALLAPSGAGKSTLLALLAGLCCPDAGRILIGDEPITDLAIGRLRQRIAWIGQNPHIFPGTLSGNVRLCRSNLEPEAIWRALRGAGLGDVARDRGPAPIGENGVGLSGGEASRLALARLLVNPQADLILADEPTAHLDTTTSESIASALITLAKGRTLIVATHDPVLAARMDRVMRLSPLRLEGAA